MSDACTISAALRCPICDGTGLDWFQRRQDSRLYDGPIPCRDCGGEGRRWCEICQFDAKPRHAIHTEPDGKRTAYLCGPCLTEWVAECARMRAERVAFAKLHDETMVKLTEGSK